MAEDTRSEYYSKINKLFYENIVSILEWNLIHRNDEPEQVRKNFETICELTILKQMY